MKCVFQNAQLGIELESKIDYEDTVCASQDFQCLYWNTSYQFTNNQIACYTPPVPYETRSALANVWPRFEVFIRTDAGVELKCKYSELCDVIYSTDFTPELQKVQV